MALLSSIIKWVEYTQSSGKLTVSLKTGRTYVYRGVPEAVYKEFINSPSLGKYYNKYIKNKYPHVRG